MDRVTGFKRPYDPNGLYGTDQNAKRRPPEWPPHTLDATSRCTVQDITRTGPPSDEPPDFPEAPLTDQLGILGELPPSLLDAYLNGQWANWPTTIDGLQDPPSPPQAIPADASHPSDAEADRMLLAQLKGACTEQADSGARTSATMKAIHRMNSLQQLIDEVLANDESRAALAQGLLPLVKRCTSPSARAFLISLFLSARRMPQHTYRSDFLCFLPTMLSPHLQHLEPSTQRYWVNACTSGFCQARTQELARQVCAHLGWPVR